MSIASVTDAYGERKFNSAVLLVQNGMLSCEPVARGAWWQKNGLKGLSNKMGLGQDPKPVGRVGVAPAHPQWEGEQGDL